MQPVLCSLPEHFRRLGYWPEQSFVLRTSPQGLPYALQFWAQRVTLVDPTDLVLDL